MDWPSATTMSAPIAPGDFDQAERHDFGDDGDQQHALGVAGLGQRAQVAQIAEEVRILHDEAGQVVVERAKNPRRPGDRAASRTISSSAMSDRVRAVSA